MKNIERKYVAIAALIPFALLTPIYYIGIIEWNTGMLVHPTYGLVLAITPCLYGVLGAVVYGVIRLLQKLIYPVGKPWISLVFLYIYFVNVYNIYII